MPAIQFVLRTVTKHQRSSSNPHHQLPYCSIHETPYIHTDLMYLEETMEERRHSLLLMGLQQKAEASLYEAFAWEATFEEGLHPEQWHDGRAFDCLVRQAIWIKRAGDYRRRRWHERSSTNTLPSTLQRQPGNLLLSERNNRRPLSVTFNEQRGVATHLYEKRREMEDDR